MKQHNGVTLIEMMLIVVIACIFFLIIFIPTKHLSSDGLKCKAGFKFVNDRQLIGPNGGGIPCDSISGPSACPQPLK